MRKEILVLLLATQIGCTQENQSARLGIEYDGVIEALQEPTIQILEVHRSNLSFRVENPTEFAFKYWAWEKNDPVVTFENREEEKWSLSYFSECGTGTDLWVLGPGESFVAEMVNDELGGLRVSMDFWKVGEDEEPFVVSGEHQGIPIISSR